MLSTPRLPRFTAAFAALILLTGLLTTSVGATTNTCIGQRGICTDSNGVSFGYTISGTTAAISTFPLGAADVVVPSEVFVGAPYPVVRIGVLAFSNDASLTSVVVPSTVTSIGQSAFANDRLLASLILPHSLVAIGANAFLNDPALVLQDEMGYIGRWSNGTHEFVTGELTSTVAAPNDLIGVWSPVFVGDPSLPGSAPDSPTQLSTVLSASSLALSWTASINTGGTPVQYEVIAIPQPTGASDCADTQNSFCTLTGLSPGTSYLLSVVAVNSSGASAPSAVQSVTTPGAAPAPPLLASPKSIHSAAGSPLQPGEGDWLPIGRPVGDTHVLFATSWRFPDASKSRVNVVWVDTPLVLARLYSGAVIPGGRMWKDTAPVTPASARTLLAAFNAGFKLKDSMGGYLSEGHQMQNFRTGGATFVIRTDGYIEIGSWNQTIERSSAITAAFQNLNLLVQNGVAVPGLRSSDVRTWGRSHLSIPNTPRSGIGVTSSGALVYVEGRLTIVQLAKALIAAGATDAMTLDMNPNFPFFVSYSPVSGVAGAGNGTLVDSAMGSASRIFKRSFMRSFITLSLPN